MHIPALSAFADHAYQWQPYGFSTYSVAGRMIDDECSFAGK
jgi:hypothetical protein